MEISEFKKYTKNLDAYTLREVDEFKIMTEQEFESYQNELENDTGNLSEWEHIRAIFTLKHQIEQWKELFFLLKSDHELLENWQTNEWMVKARKMGIDV
jgi:endonuclease I